MSTPNYHMPLTKFIYEEELEHPYTTGEFTDLLNACQTIAKSISALLRRSGLSEIYGISDSKREPKKLQTVAHEIFVNILSETGCVGVIASHNSQKVIEVDKPKKGKYMVVVKPLDNIEYGLTTGSTFGIMMRSDERIPTSDDVLHAANKMAAAGYVVYGSATLFVFSTGQGVNEFVLDPQIGEFLLVEKDLRIAERGMIYSVDEGFVAMWDDAIKEYVREKKFPDRKKAYFARYSGSVVADVHKTLKQGGIFMYPRNKEEPNGGLKLLCQCKPLAFVVTQAGGLASDGVCDVLEVAVKEVHQRCPVFMGSSGEVREVLEFIQKHTK